MANLAQLGADKGDPRQRVDTNWHYIDNVSWKAGKNDIKFGYEFRRTSISQIFNRRFRGGLDFPDLPSFLQGIPDEGTQYQAALASQRVDLSPGNRKALIASLEAKGVGNIEF